LRFIISGAAGFIGSHLCDRLIAEGHSVVAVDSLITGALRNIDHLRESPRFQFMEHDVCETFDVDGPIDGVLHLASLASPKDYLEHPIETLEVGSTGTRNMLEIARQPRGSIPVDLDLGVLWRPHCSPASGNLLGECESGGAALLL
jgi:dTDP-glucose 4,6-dehydratase